MYTVADIDKYIEENAAQLHKTLTENTVVPDGLKTDPYIVELWNAGAWLMDMLRELGADEEEASNIGFAHGQRSVTGKAKEWAVKFVNEFAEKGTTKDRPGPELADEINREIFG